MTLQERIYRDLKIHMELKDHIDLATKDSLKVIAGELQRQSKKILSDSEVVKILKLLMKYEIERLNIYGAVDSKYLKILKFYIPEQLSKEAIVIWIKENVNFSELKNKMQAISIVTKHFGPAVDNAMVKEIIQDWKV